MVIKENTAAILVIAGLAIRSQGKKRMHEETNEDEKDKLELGEKILVTII